jgi:hypothetical protein
MKKINRVNLRLGRWSFIISLIALIVSIFFGFQSHFSQQEEIKLEEKSILSKVVAQIEIDYNQDKVLFEQISIRDSDAYYKQKYNLVLNNLGQANASITDMYLSLESKMVADQQFYKIIKPKADQAAGLNGELTNIGNTPIDFFLTSRQVCLKKICFTKTKPT